MNDEDQQSIDRLLIGAIKAAGEPPQSWQKTPEEVLAAGRVLRRHRRWTAVTGSFCLIAVTALGIAALRPAESAPDLKTGPASAMAAPSPSWQPSRAVAAPRRIGDLDQLRREVLARRAQFDRLGAVLVFARVARGSVLLGVRGDLAAARRVAASIDNRISVVDADQDAPRH